MRPIDAARRVRHVPRAVPRGTDRPTSPWKRAARAVAGAPPGDAGARGASASAGGPEAPRHATTPRGWTGALRSRTPQAVALLFSALIAADLRSLVVRARPAPLPPQRAGAASVDPARGVARALDDARGLFGRAAAAATEANALPSSLVLVGTIATDHPDTGFAIIGENASLARLVRARGNVASNIVLAAVFPDHVLVSRDGRLESVPLPKQLVGLRSPREARARGARAAEASIAAAANDPDENARRPIEFPAVALMHALMLRPGAAAGQSGRVVHGAASPVLAALGLAVGDVLISVNGVPLGDPTAGRALTDILDGRVPGSIDVIRRQSALSVPITAASVAAALAAIEKANGA